MLGFSSPNMLWRVVTMTLKPFPCTIPQTWPCSLVAQCFVSVALPVIYTQNYLKYCFEILVYNVLLRICAEAHHKYSTEAIQSWKKYYYGFNDNIITNPIGFPIDI